MRGIFALLAFILWGLAWSVPVPFFYRSCRPDSDLARLASRWDAKPVVNPARADSDNFEVVVTSLLYDPADILEDATMSRRASAASRYASPGQVAQLALHFWCAKLPPARISSTSYLIRGCSALKCRKRACIR